MKILDSGSTREFPTGAHRDSAENKGRCDLLPLDIINMYMEDNILLCISDFIEYSEPRKLWTAFSMFSKETYGSVNKGLLAVSHQYEGGALKYGENNWKKGMPLHDYISSGVRHYLKFRDGIVDEPHDIAFLWNILGALWTYRFKPELNDIHKVEIAQKPINVLPTIPSLSEVGRFKLLIENSSNEDITYRICAFMDEHEGCDSCPVNSKYNGHSILCCVLLKENPEEFRTIIIKYLEELIKNE